jgi:hypothetical protein
MLLSSGKKLGSGPANVSVSLLFGKQGRVFAGRFNRVFKKLAAARSKSAKMPLSEG